MTTNAKAFCLILALSVFAFTIATFIRMRNLEELLAAQKNQNQVSIPKVENPLLTKEGAGGGEPAAGGDGTAEAPAAPAVPTSTPASSPAAVPPTIFSSPDNITSAVLVGYPVLTNPFSFYGTTTAFENRASWRVRDAAHALLGEGSFDVHSPDAGVPGSFTVTGTFDKMPTTASGTLLIFQFSPKDGTPVHIATIPIRFAK